MGRLELGCSFTIQGSCIVVALHGRWPPRFAVEITLAPWTRMQLKPVCLGQNARHPRLPLQNAISAL